MTISEICIDYFWVMPKTPKFVENAEIPYITSKNLRNGSIDYNNCKYITEDDFNKLITKRNIQEGDFLISMIGTVGEVAIVKRSDLPLYGQNMYLLRPNYERINQRFLYNFITSSPVYSKLQSIINGAIQGYLRDKDILNLEYIDRTIEEQVFIANQLDNIKKTIDLKQKQVNNLDNLIKSRFIEMFGDLFFSDAKHYTVPDVAYVYIGLVTTMTKHYVSEGTPLIFNSTVRDNRFEFKERVFLDEEFATANAHRKHKKGDVITVHTGDVGTSAIIDDDLDGSLGFATIVSRINEENIIRPSYLCDFLNSNLCKNQLSSLIRGERNNLNLKEFNQILLTIPSMEQQIEWETIRKKADRLKFAIQKEIELLKELLDKKMNEYFGC